MRNLWEHVEGGHCKADEWFPGGGFGTATSDVLSVWMSVVAW